MNRVTWDNNGLIEDVRAAAWEGGVIPEDQKPKAWQKKFDSYNYDTLLQKFAHLSKTGGYGKNNPAEGVGTFVMPYTVNKFIGIINKIDEAKKELGVENLKVSTAGTAVVGIPIMSTQYGDSRAGNTIETAQGGLWWGGNLKGLMHSIALKGLTVFDKLYTVAAMTYESYVFEKECCWYNQNPKWGRISRICGS